MTRIKKSIDVDILLANNKACWEKIICIITLTIVENDKQIVGSRKVCGNLDSYQSQKMWPINETIQ